MSTAVTSEDPALAERAIKRAAEAARPLPVVCHVVHSLNIGGAELLATRIARRLSERYDTVFACLDEVGPLAEQLDQAGVPYRHVGRRGGLDLGCVARLRKWFRQHNVALVHAHQYTPFAYSLLTGLGRRRPPVVFTEHGRFYPDRSSWKRRMIHGWLLQPEDRVVGVGHAVRRALHQVERMDEQRIEVIYNGIPLAAYQDVISQRSPLRAHQGAGPDTFVVAQVARFDPIKNHALAIAALAQLKDKVPNVQWWFVGDGPERTACEACVAAAGLQSRVKFWGERRDIPALLAAADVVALTSHSEGIPLVLIEALAAGRPVVATDVGGVSEVVEHEVQGLLAPPGEPAALAGHLATLAELPERRSALGLAGPARAERFSESEMVNAYERLYAAMLGGEQR